MKIAAISTTPPLTSHGRTNADRLESAFLAEMLKYTGIETAGSSFSGGIGETQFASWLTEQRAEALSRRIDLKFAGSVTE